MVGSSTGEFAVCAVRWMRERRAWCSERIEVECDGDESKESGAV